MQNFFQKFCHNPCAIDIHKMHQISQLINTRDKSSTISLLDFIMLFADRIEEWEEARENFEDAPESDNKEEVEALEIAQVKISVCVSLLAKYFYPVMEQLERLVDDGIIMSSPKGGS